MSDPVKSIFARKALLAQGWEDGVRLSIDGGRIERIETAAVVAEDDTELGIVIPGLANAHSHAFQRALAGHTERRGPAGKDNFWTWRSRMYELAAAIDADALQAIACQAYTEMLHSGYTSVAEFHYLHSEPDQAKPGDAMFNALRAAADRSGIRLCYVPVLYERAGFEEPLPATNQQRFAQSLERFCAHYEQARDSGTDTLSVGIGAHSLRAVFPESLEKIVEIASRDRAAMHIHVAEQMREVDQCLDVYGARPVRWLIRHFELDRRWCLVHATHMDDEERSALAETGAVVCLCPSTEANLGDGLFKLQSWLAANGRIAIGSDSHVSINPFEELRWLEYGQRLVSQSRNIAAIRQDHTGRNLFDEALAGGNQALGLPDGQLRAGAPADLVALDDHSPMLLGHGSESILDALVFSGFTLPIDRVMVHGRWQVRNGRHIDAEQVRDEYARILARLADGGGS